MIAYVTVSDRAAPIAEGGCVLKINWDTKEILEQTPVIPPTPKIPDPPPKGWGRGGRGIVVIEDEVFVASYHTIHVFDLQLRPLRHLATRSLRTSTISVATAIIFG